MRFRLTLLLCALSLLALAGCFTDRRDWMKVDQKYTTAEFQRDYKDCGGSSSDPDEACMRQHGWVPVNPAKSEAPPPPPSTPRGRGRY